MSLVKKIKLFFLPKFNKILLKNQKSKNGQFSEIWGPDTFPWSRSKVRDKD
jgi:hypothetical protein